MNGFTFPSLSRFTCIGFSLQENFVCVYACCVVVCHGVDVLWWLHVLHSVEHCGGCGDNGCRVIDAAGLCAELGRVVLPDADSPKFAAHAVVERIIRNHLHSMLKSLENAFKRYSDSRVGTLSCKEWVDLCRLLGVNLGEHFWSRMNAKVCTRRID